MDLLKRYWGFIAFLAAIGGWIGLVAGSFTGSVVAVILIFSVAALGYFGFWAPLWCGAIIAMGRCAVTTPTAC